MTETGRDESGARRDGSSGDGSSDGNGDNGGGDGDESSSGESGGERAARGKLVAEVFSRRWRDGREQRRESAARGVRKPMGHSRGRATAPSGAAGGPSGGSAASSSSGTTRDASELMPGWLPLAHEEYDGLPCYYHASTRVVREGWARSRERAAGKRLRGSSRGGRTPCLRGYEQRASSGQAVGVRVAADVRLGPTSF